MDPKAKLFIAASGVYLASVILRQDRTIRRHQSLSAFMIKTIKTLEEYAPAEVIAEIKTDVMFRSMTDGL